MYETIFKSICFTLLPKIICILKIIDEKKKPSLTTPEKKKLRWVQRMKDVRVDCRMSPPYVSEEWGGSHTHVPLASFLPSFLPCLLACLICVLNCIHPLPTPRPLPGWLEVGPTVD
jgi:hypothetical protein